LTKITHIFAFFILIVIPVNSYSQFYQGSVQEYGKNRIQYHGFSWKYHDYKRFKVYYSGSNKELALYAAKSLDHYLTEAEGKLEFIFPEKIEVIVFENQSKFRQSNIGLMQDELTQIAGTSKIFGSKMFIYYEDDHQQFNYNIKGAIYEVLIKNMLLGQDWKNVLKSSIQSGIPDWMEQGLVKYLTYGWNSKIESIVKDLVLTGRINKFNSLTQTEKIYAGAAMWNYIAENYGKTSIPTALNLTRFTQSIERSLYTTISLDFQTLNRNYVRFYKKRYINDYKYQSEPDGNLIEVKQKKERVFYSVKLSPDGKQVAYVENILGQYRIKIYDLITKKTKTIFKAEPKLERIQDFSYPVLEWHPSGAAIGFFTQRKDELKFCIYVLENKPKNKASLTVIPVDNLDKVLSFDYSDDGRMLIMSAVIDGKTDLFTYTVSGGKIFQITNDIYDELNPRYADKSQKIVFSSNRKSDTIFKPIDIQFLDNKHDIFELDVRYFKRTFKYLKRITDTEDIHETIPYPTENGNYYFTSEQNGINNLYLAKIDSIIDFIDTTIHYRDDIHILPLTSLVTEIKEYNIGLDKEMVYLVYQNRKYKFYKKVASEAPIKEIWDASYLFKEDKTNKSNLKSQDTAYINNVYHEKVYVKIGEEQPPETPKTERSRQDSLIAAKKLRDLLNRKPRYTIYNINFTKDFLVSTFDNNFLFPNYQIYQGPGSIYINPGLNSLTKIGASDLFDDYKLLGGIRIPLSLNSGGETLLSIENLKNRFDHRLLYYRQKAISSSDLSKTVTHDVRYRISYPFSEILALRLTTNLRQDRKIFLPSSEFFKDQFNNNSGLNLELVFDNSIPMEMNIRRGFRMKIFAEYLQELSNNYRPTFNLGLDLRSYTRLTRNLIWVNRLAAATSLGEKKLLYYMGAINNWVLRPAEDFNFDIDVDPNQGFGYQTIATPLRGFIQNTRNGNSFMLFTSEIRLPVFTFFSSFPIKSEFFRYFQIVGFADVGSAWTGPHPLSPENFFNNQIINDFPVEINIKNLIEPIVGDLGFGVRSKVLGYFVKLDAAWGIEDLRFKQPVVQISLNLDI